MIIRNATSHSDVHLDFVPMVDVLFNLLIFFLLATSLQQSEREMQIALPHTRAAGPITGVLKEIIINIDAGGQAIVAGRPIGDDELNGMLKTAVAGNPQQKVNVRADRTTAYANVARILDLCKGAGIAEPFLGTIPAN